MNGTQEGFVTATTASFYLTAALIKVLGQKGILAERDNFQIKEIAKDFADGEPEAVIQLIDAIFSGSSEWAIVDE